MNYAEFENKVKSMSAHDIIMSMVEGLRNTRTEIDMDTYGYVRDGICYGCAATNSVLHIMEADEDEVVDHILCVATRDNRDDFLSQFESAIDWLREGQVSYYNDYAYDYGFAPITLMPGLELPRLGNDYTEEELQQYVKLAKHQLTEKQ